ncbi:hypothetical protein ALC60_02056 [Trachymyrmex zeteki]|uniref:Uncharacterized protein n=1 Tax=Mycetomoellerius zeteki TaxID=64791 RepID=A0A151XF39_9HYME|nr:hypothetical protein ALC60_02056 [Trachymyrmex zeteki]
MDIHIDEAERGNEKGKERIGRGRALMRGHNEVGGWHRLASLDCPQDPDRISPRSSPRRASRPFSTSDIPPQPLRPQEPSQADTKPIRAKRWEHYHIAFFAEILTTVYTHNHHVWDFLHSFLFFSLSRNRCLQLASKKKNLLVALSYSHGYVCTTPSFLAKQHANRLHTHRKFLVRGPLDNSMSLGEKIMLDISKRERDDDIIIDIAGGSDDGLGPFSKPCIRLSDRARATTTGREKEGKSYRTNLYVISCEKKEFHAETGSFKVQNIGGEGGTSTLMEEKLRRRTGEARMSSLYWREREKGRKRKRREMAGSDRELDEERKGRESQEVEEVGGGGR